MEKIWIRFLHAEKNVIAFFSFFFLFFLVIEKWIGIMNRNREQP